jgi:hypothetical protein
MKTFYRITISVLLVLALPDIVYATSIVYSISTDFVTEQRNGVDATTGERMFQSGDTMSAVFTYSDDGGPGIETPNHVGTLYSNITDFTVTANGFEFTDASGFTTVSNDRWPFGVVDPVDALGMNAHLPPTIPVGYPQYADNDGEVFTLRDMRLFWGERFSETDFLNDEQLPATLPVPGSGNGVVALVFATYDTDGTTILDEHVVLGAITGMSVIPLPAALWLFASALGVLGLKRRFLM